MFAEEYVSPTLPHIAPESDGDFVLSSMREHQTPQLPVVENRHLIGITDRAEVLAHDGPEILSDSELMYVLNRQHVFDAVEMMYRYGLAVIPVVDQHHEYTGCITREDLVRCLAEYAGVQDQGNLIVLQMPRHDYTLTQISSIVESNYGKVLGVFVTPVPDSYEIYVTLRITGEQLTPLAMAFERHGYRVAFTFSDADQVRQTQEHYDGLMRFLAV